MFFILYKVIYDYILANKVLWLARCELQQDPHPDLVSLQMTLKVQGSA